MNLEEKNFKPFIKLAVAAPCVLNLCRKNLPLFFLLLAAFGSNRENTYNNGFTWHLTSLQIQPSHLTSQGPLRRRMSLAVRS